jgi:hypothetical protein
MESLVVIGVMGAVLVSVTQIFASNYTIFLTQTARTDNDTGAILAVRQISEIARGATAVVDSHVIGGTTYTSSASALVLRIPARDAGGNIVAGVNDYIAFARDTTDTEKIIVATEPGAGSARPSGTRAITFYNDTMVFRYNDADITKADKVTLYLVNSQTVRSQTFTTRAWTALFLRNKSL